MTLMDLLFQSLKIKTTQNIIKNLSQKAIYYTYDAHKFI